MGKIRWTWFCPCPSFVSEKSIWSKDFKYVCIYSKRFDAHKVFRVFKFTESRMVVTGAWKWGVRSFV
jgi:hypothetical protein